MASTKRRIWDGEALTPKQYEALAERLGRAPCWRPHEPDFIFGRSGSSDYTFRPADSTFNGDHVHRPSRGPN